MLSSHFYKNHAIFLVEQLKYLSIENFYNSQNGGIPISLQVF